jgi:hypothetical protein
MSLRHSRPERLEQRRHGATGVMLRFSRNAQIRTTTDTFSHVMPTLGRDAADRMRNALWD